jgi:hypothetical protein
MNQFISMIFESQILFDLCRISVGAGVVEEESSSGVQSATRS